MPDVLVVMPSIPAGAESRESAIRSVQGEEVLYDVGYGFDRYGYGPARIRNEIVSTNDDDFEWVAFLDDDDEFYPGHLTKLVRHAEESGADVVYPWFDIETPDGIRNDLDPLGAFGKEFNPNALRENNYIPVTALVRTNAFRAVGGFPIPGSPEWPHKDCEDWALWLRLLDAGYKFSHLPERTWKWRWHSRNTTGQPNKARELYP